MKKSFIIVLSTIICLISSISFSQNNNSPADLERIRKSISVRVDGTIMIDDKPVSVKTLENIAKRLLKEDELFVGYWQEYQDARSEYIRYREKAYRQLDKNLDYKIDLENNPFIVDAEESELYKSIQKKDQKIYNELARLRSIFVTKRSVVLEEIVIFKSQLINERSDARDAKRSINEEYLAKHNKPLDEIVESDLPISEAFIKDLKDCYKDFSKECKALESSIENLTKLEAKQADLSNHTLTQKYAAQKEAKQKELSAFVKKWVADVYGKDAVKRAKKAREILEAKKKAEQEKEAGKPEKNVKPKKIK